MVSEKALRFLLIDDDKVNNYLSKEFLKLYLPNANATEALNGEHGIEQLNLLLQSSDTIPHIILLDINMPIMDGWDFLEAFGQIKDQAVSSIKIFMYTSSVYPEDFSKARTFSSVTNIFSKPLDKAKIEEMVASLA